MEKKLIKQIRRLCEKQYRKGFEHGYDACDNDLMSPQQASFFRKEGEEEGYKQMRNPFTNHICNYADIPNDEGDIRRSVETDRLLDYEHLIITEDKVIDLMVEKFWDMLKEKGMVDID